MKSTQKVLIPLLRCRIKGPMIEPIEQDKKIWFDLGVVVFSCYNLSTLKIANVVKKFFYCEKIIDLRFDLSKPMQLESDFALFSFIFI
jgi:hypothetical protein